MTLLALVGCMGGPNLATRIGELRVVAAKADPPGVGLGEPFDLVVWVADPLDRGSDVLSWSCVEDIPCAPIRSEVPDLVEGTTPPLTQPRLAAPAPIWVLACSDGDCGDLDDPPEARLRDPFGWLQDLPLAGVSAASRLPPIAEDPTVPLTNPLVTAAPKTVLDRDALQVDLTFTVLEATSAFGYATTGGFDAPLYEPDAAGNVTLTWFPDPEQEAGEVFVVFTNLLGGSEVWQAPVP
ncbi:MAG: hypothetical protein AAF602_18055 [Myxococcota bacterium]